MPEWFHTLSGRMDGSEFAAIVAVMAATDGSVSVGGEAAVRADGAGASGGGASGAG